MNSDTSFPDDENGQILQYMAEQGDNLSIPREIDFAVVFPTEEAALKFAVILLRKGQKVSFSEYEEGEDMPWQVLAHPFMEPSYENISGYEDALAEDADELGGENDGWGCVAQQS